MNLDLSVASLVRASSGLLMAGFGLYLLTLRPGTLRSRALGAYHLALGPVFVLTNLLRFDVPALTVWFRLTVPLFAVSSVALVALVWREGRGDRRAQGAFAVAFTVLLAANVAAALLVPGDVSRGYVGATGELGADLNRAYDEGRFLFGALSAAVPAAAIALAVRFRSTPDSADRRRLALLTTGLVLYPVFDKAASILLEPASTAEGWIALPAFAAAAVAWALAANGAASDAARTTALAIAIAGVAGLAAASIAGDDLGLLGVSRLAGLAVLAYAIFRLDLLGTKFTPRAVRRGSLATAGLAALFIVAQVAQEFFAAEYGLLIGGLVAGALLFAARPIERATERLAVGSGPRRGSGSRADEESYRRTIRLARRGGPLSAEDEVHLADLGERLGIPAGRAREIHHEAESDVRGSPR